jgi:hypothetical protein
VKAALNERNILVGDPRLPILPLDDEQQDFLEKVLSQE